MKFFFDNCLPRRIPEALQILDENQNLIQHLTQKFSNAAIPDLEWLGTLKREGGWTIISVDQFNKTEEEKRAYKESGDGVFIFAGGHAQLRRWDIIRKVVNWWPEIMESARRGPKGQAWQIPMRGSQLRNL